MPEECGGFAVFRNGRPDYSAASATETCGCGHPWFSHKPADPTTNATGKGGYRSSGCAAFFSLDAVTVNRDTVCVCGTKWAAHAVVVPTAPVGTLTSVSTQAVNPTGGAPPAASGLTFSQPPPVTAFTGAVTSSLASVGSTNDRRVAHFGQENQHATQLGLPNAGRRAPRTAPATNEPVTRRASSGRASRASQQSAAVATSSSLFGTSASTASSASTSTPTPAAAATATATTAASTSPEYANFLAVLFPFMV
ncbi:hypothetical protein FA95DRAFT_1611483 [Auriscalpium vulgare]|uniref:Uncharacterized protein n=1 Tax=Auriscalpium vulgare TaxID=40419 RepID=A0ACB8RB78_9AGAM|nr:hypothetical protein FA95DRAFT_1611483 [Auriscalpium vulgare]